ncbi:MAG: hormogonium polysaccharide secretion pseudopilin HpsB [Nostoc sp. EfeVER01]|uniref:hormogonium polysaccharide secretion pseudopilin HpsB n=1 Tax=unclassified Nostoc TaxID=2593658 RepID=UPI002AD2474E|nr:MULTISPECIES: hormogonium polysaccharide secretion pseudopilin HpsB [unclassified Nostoc]MDZ7946100.1 hormogonium polysaccharide secretion pseudopilin HpsB [Nostoc sp. EfeVER01]MDZ7992057.1 hormogonium polysaccharide secretion pseudopilin HpsB [Nostoc sp. EspVER01]
MNPRQLKELSAQSNESGFTIIESLVAILVVAILLVAIAPVLVMSTATRVQAKRVELATGAAKAFIDAIKSKTISDPTITVTLTASTSRNVSSSSSDYLLSSTSAPTASTGLYCFNKNGSLANPNCTSDLFYIQAIRVAVTDSDADKGQGYRLGVRVYRSDAEFGTLTAGSSGKTAATFTGGLGDRKAPLVEMTTEIVRGQSSYSALCDRLGGCQP